MNSISFRELAGGEVVGLDYIEIRQIPHITLFGKDTPDEMFYEEHQLAFKAMLEEWYQQYKLLMRQTSGEEPMLALEMLWISETVVGQVSRAKIRPFFVLRALDRSRATVTEALSRLKHNLTEALQDRKYTVQSPEEGELMTLLGNTPIQDAQAIAKENQFFSLQNPLMPSCLHFDLLTRSGEIASVIDAMVRYPGCAVSLQLMPAQFTQHETERVNSFAQVLNSLANGLNDFQIGGSVSFTSAQRPAQVFSTLSNNGNHPLFAFNLLVYGERQGVSQIVSRLISYCNGASDSPVSLQTYSLTGSGLMDRDMFYPQPWAVQEQLQAADTNEFFFNNRSPFYQCNRLSHLLTENECAVLFTLPVGSSRIAMGFDVIQSNMDGRQYAAGIIDNGDIMVGKLKSSGLTHEIGLSLKDLTKHMLVVGTPGSGKTTFSVSLLDRLWKQHHIPFLVIEPAKNEYRALVQSIPDLQVFTPGKNFISPFVFNPFVPPKNVRLETYKTTLKTAFAAGVSMSTPLDKIFEETVNNCYSDFRWLDNYTVDDQGKTFSIHDFIKCFQETFENIGYSGDARNIGRAGVVRLKGLVHLFDNYHSIPIHDLLTKPTVIELAAIENSDEKALIIALLLLSILSYVNSNYVGDGSLKNVVLVEEAHVLLDADSNAGQGDANPSAIAQGLVKRMLAECRSYGVSLVIADQSPRKVTTDVVALTDIKIAFRLVEGMDKQILADSVGMNDMQVQRLAKLKPGEAFLFFNRLEEAEEIVTPDYRLANNISISLSDDGIRELSTYWKGREELLRPYPECAEISCCKCGCCYERRILAREIARRIVNSCCNAQTADFQVVLEIFSKLITLIRAELNDEPYTPELKACVKVHLWRKLFYETKLNITHATITKSLQKD